jgi:PIN domain nuclease of toxin-antitoxin system
MKALLDRGVWFRRYHRLPMAASLKRFLNEEVEEFHLCSLSIAEISFKWRRGRLPGVPDPAQWVDHAITGFLIQRPTVEASLKAGRWDWEHGDLVDRILAAIAAETNVCLVHTDSVLKNLSGFPQKYFRNLIP